MMVSELSISIWLKNASLPWGLLYSLLNCKHNSYLHQTKYQVLPMASTIINASLQRPLNTTLSTEVSLKTKNIAASRPELDAVKQMQQTQKFAPPAMTESIETLSRKSKDMNLENTSLNWSLNSMQGMAEMVNRVSDITKQAGSEELSDEQRGQLQEEAGILMSQVRDTVKNTEFMGVKLFEQDGSVPVGSDGSVTIKTQDLLTGFTESGAFDIDLSSADKALQSQQSVQKSMDMLGRGIAEFGSLKKQLDEKQAAFSMQFENQQAAKSTYVNSNVPMELTEAQKAASLVEAGSAALQQNVSMFTKLTDMVRLGLR